jgi:hypothetical protein
MVGDVTNGYLSMKECSGVAWPSLLKAGNVTKMVSELSKASEDWHALTGVRPGMLQFMSMRYMLIQLRSKSSMTGHPQPH